MKKLDYVKLTVLCDNAVGIIGGIGEHGYSIYIETAGGPYLFDTGSGIGIISNAKLLEKNLQSLQKIFLSHGHYDHTGGLSDVLDAVLSVPVYAHPSIFGENIAFRKRMTGWKADSSVYPREGCFLKQKVLIFIWIEDLERSGKVFFSQVRYRGPRNLKQETNRLKVKLNDTFTVDSFPDDQALVLSTQKGLVVLLGCSHAGTINTLSVRAVTIER